MTMVYGTLLVRLPQDTRACYQAISHTRRRSINELVAPKSHLYLGISHPQVLPYGIEILAHRGFVHKTIFVLVQEDLIAEVLFDGYFSLVTTPFLSGYAGNYERLQMRVGNQTLCTLRRLKAI